MYLTESKLLANLAPPNKQYFKVNSDFESRDHESPNHKFSYHLIDRERLLSIVLRAGSFSADKPLGFEDPTFQYHLVFSKYNKVVEVLNKVVLHHYQSNFDQEKALSFLIHFQQVHVLFYLK